MANQKTLLSELRSRSAVDCDTLDLEGMPYIEPYRTNNDLILTHSLSCPDVGTFC
jgi:transaldolase